MSLFISHFFKHLYTVNYKDVCRFRSYVVTGPKRRKARTQKDIKDIFSGQFDERLYIKNPAYEKELPKHVAFYTDGQIIDMATETSKTVEQVVKLMRLQKDGEGRWFKEY